MPLKDTWFCTRCDSSGFADLSRLTAKMLENIKYQDSRCRGIRTSCPTKCGDTVIIEIPRYVLKYTLKWEEAGTPPASSNDDY